MDASTYQGDRMQRRYYGRFTPENLLFNANLQEFDHRLSLIASLHMGGKLSPTEAYCQVEILWEAFETATRSLFLS